MKRSLRVLSRPGVLLWGSPFRALLSMCWGERETAALGLLFFYVYFRVYVIEYDRNSHFRAVFFRVYCGGGAETAGCVLGCMCHGDTVCGLFRSEVKQSIE